MHSTHQFFLTRRSVYVLVLNAREDEKANRLHYWLRLIRTYAPHTDHRRRQQNRRQLVIYTR